MTAHPQLLWRRESARRARERSSPEASLLKLPVAGAAIYGGGPTGLGTSAARLAERARALRDMARAG